MKQNKLHSIKKTGYEVPEDYFESLEGQIMGHIKLSEVGPTGFNIPDGYLESVEDQVINKVSGKSPVKVIPLFSKRNVIYASSIAAAVLVLLNLSIFEKNSWDLEDQTVENYIIDEAISSYEIASLLEDEDLIEENFVNHNFSEENIENYVLDNIDIETLILE